MAEVADSIVRLTSTPREIEAATIVAALADHGVRATTTGTYTAGFRAEAPGWVHILVAADDLTRSQELLEDIRRETAEIDWANVDIGTPLDEEDNDGPQSSLISLSSWRRVAQVLILIYFGYLAAGIAWSIARAVWSALSNW